MNIQVEFILPCDICRYPLTQIFYRETKEELNFGINRLVFLFQCDREANAGEEKGDE